jgi:ferredoxin
VSAPAPKAPWPRTGAIPGTRLSRRFSIEVGDRTIGQLMRPRLQPYVRRLPRLLRSLRKIDNPPLGPWPDPSTDTDPRLLRVAGVLRNPEAEERAFREEPLGEWAQAHLTAITWLQRRYWATLWMIWPAYLRLGFQARETAKVDPPRSASAARRHTPAELTRMVKEEAARLGINAVGVAPYDRKYVFAEYQDLVEPGSVIVCLLEQDWAATQAIPSHRGERAAFATYVELMERTIKLAEMLHGLGYRAQAQPMEGYGVAIHYAVQAGLGQLGLNGQLLTPETGSRARPGMISTNAELVFDEPVDYGIEEICNSCKVCIRRCPVGALPAQRREFRGVVKGKLKAERCAPIVAQANGCAICMKVCPVQRYGLDAVKETFLETGKILGKDSDELEGYTWPIDGRHYGPREKPRVTKELLNPPGWRYE